MLNNVNDFIKKIMGEMQLLVASGQWSVAS